MLVARPSTFQRVTSPRQSDSGTRCESSGERNLKREQKEADRTVGFSFLARLCRVTMFCLSYLGIPKTCLPLSALRAHHISSIKIAHRWKHHPPARCARDKATIYSFAVLFIECLTFLPTFVHTIIFMYYVINKGGDRECAPVSVSTGQNKSLGVNCWKHENTGSISFHSLHRPCVLSLANPIQLKTGDIYASDANLCFRA